MISPFCHSVGVYHCSLVKRSINGDNSRKHSRDLKKDNIKAALTLFLEVWEKLRCFEYS